MVDEDRGAADPESDSAAGLARVRQGDLQQGWLK